MSANFLWRICERYEPCKIVKITPCKFTCEGVYFCYFIGRQPDSEGTLSRAAHGVCHYFTGIFHLLSHSIFLIWPHFYDKFLEKYIRLIFLPHFTTTTSGLYHSRYGFWQVHFRHLILHMRLLCNMIVDIHCDLCIWMAHDILHNFGIDIVLTQSGTSRMTKSMWMCQV